MFPRCHTWSVNLFTSWRNVGVNGTCPLPVVQPTVQLETAKLCRVRMMHHVQVCISRLHETYAAAKAAAAAAARIAAQFSKAEPGASVPAGPGALVRHRDYEEPDGAFSYDIDINDHRNRYLLTKKQTQEDIYRDTNVRVYTRGTWYPDKSLARLHDPPLYLHLTADTRESLDRGIARVNVLMTQDLPPLLDDRRGGVRDPSTWPEERVTINLEPLRNFNVRAKIVGPTGLFVKYIQHETRVRVQIKGQGSGYLEADSGQELNEPMHIHLTGPEEAQLRRAREMALDLVDAVATEWKKARAVVGGGNEYYSVQNSYGIAADDAAPPPPEEPAPPPPDEPAPPPPDAEVPPPPEDELPPPPPTDAPADPEPPQTEPQLDAEEAAALHQYWMDYVAWEQSFVNYHGRRPTKEEGAQDVPPEYR